MHLLTGDKMVQTTFNKEELPRWQAYKAAHPGESEFRLVKKILLEAIAKEGF